MAMLHWGLLLSSHRFPTRLGARSVAKAAGPGARHLRAKDSVKSVATGRAAGRSARVFLWKAFVKNEKIAEFPQGYPILSLMTGSSLKNFVYSSVIHIEYSLHRVGALNLFLSVTSPAALSDAWLRTLKKGGGPGGDGETIADFAQMADFRLARLAHELQSDLYRPGPLRRVPIPKRSGGTRTLAIPCVVDRIAQRSAAKVLSTVLEPQFEESSFGYRPGRSVGQAVARVDYLRRKGYRWVVDADIKAFFDSVRHDLLLDRLAGAGVEGRLVDLVALWLDGFSGDGVGLAQGSPISPVLANLHLDALDEAFGEKGPVRIVRFADDFVLLTRHKPGAEGALARARDVLEEGGLELNLHKTRIVPYEQALRFLGHMFLGGMVMRSEEEDEPARALTYGGTPSEEEDDAGRALLADRAPAPAKALPPPSDPGEIEDFDDESLSSGRAPLYLFEPGHRLVAEREGFAVLGHGRVRLRLPATMVSRIDLGAEVEAEDAALRVAAAHRIPVALLNEGGLPQSILLPAMADDAALHLAQARTSLDPERAGRMAAVLVGGRIRNAHALLKRLNRRRSDPVVEDVCSTLKMCWRKAEVGGDVAALRGIEASAARDYWPALSACLEHGFTLGSRRDTSRARPFNAILDYTASLLTRDMRSAVLRARLHPGFGTLHASRDGQDACVYDLIEPFRAPLAEGLAVYLVNNRILQLEDFVAEPPKTARAHGIRLIPGASRKLIQGWERWVARPILDQQTRRRTTWRNLLLIEARRYARAAEEQADYIPYRMKH